MEYLGVRFNGDWSSSGSTFYVANRERWWPTPTINILSFSFSEQKPNSKQNETYQIDDKDVHAQHHTIKMIF